MKLLMDNYYQDLYYRNNEFLFDKSQSFRTSISWHIPTQELIDELKKYSPILSVCSGYAYTESLMKENNIDIIATDIEPNTKNTYCVKGKFFMDVEEIDGKDAVIKYSDRNVFLAWPPYDNNIAYEVVKAMNIDRFLIYIGESEGGCTGNDDFFEYLDSNFIEIKHNIPNPQWSGLHDYVYIYKKVKHIYNL